jgi:hypothetical protein
VVRYYHVQAVNVMIRMSSSCKRSSVLGTRAPEIELIPHSLNTRQEILSITALIVAPMVLHQVERKKKIQKLSWL